eukprot:5416-Heterococcus_DN1.PRE.4
MHTAVSKQKCHATMYINDCTVLWQYAQQTHQKQARSTIMSAHISAHYGNVHCSKSDSVA